MGVECGAIGTVVKGGAGSGKSWDGNWSNIYFKLSSHEAFVLRHPATKVRIPKASRLAYMTISAWVDYAQFENKFMSDVFQDVMNSYIRNMDRRNDWVEHFICNMIIGHSSYKYETENTLGNLPNM